MLTCTHVQWLELSRSDLGWSVSYASRLQALAADLPSPATQYPGVIFFLGRRAKSVALRSIFSCNNTKRRKAHGIANLYIDLSTQSAVYPIYLADCTVNADPVNDLGPWNGCHEVQSYCVNWGKGHLRTLRHVTNEIHSRLLFPFSDVICLFADDLDDCLERIMAWVTLPPTFVLPAAVKPRIVVVRQKPNVHIQPLEDIGASPDFQRRFQSLIVVDLTATGDLSPLTKYGKLREILLCEVDRAREVRIAANVLFSANHLAAFFFRALRYFAQGVDQLVAPLTLSRESRPVAQDLAKHLSTFFDLCGLTQVPWSSAASFVSSAILLDAYPPGMHGFEPRSIFAHFYQRHCANAIQGSPYLLERLAESSVQQVEDVFVALAAPVLSGAKSARDIRRAQTAEHAHLWALLKPTETCLLCVARYAHSTLPCGHVICDTCVRTFGSRHAGAEYSFWLPTCLLCLSRQDFTIRLKPLTAKPRLLSIDGGGIKGAVALEFLTMLEAALGPAQSLQDYFEMAIGTSSGGIIVLDLFANGSPVTQSSEKFDRLARQVFPNRRPTSSSCLAYIRDLIIWWLSDSRYPSVPLEDALKEVFGASRGLSDSSTSQTKIAVTATSTSDARLCLLANYNGSVDRTSNTAYRFLRPRNFEDEARLWEAARYTSAAPGYFSPKLYRAFGFLQDGGLSANNPLEAGISELDIVWPHCSSPDVAVSVGTGTPAESRNPFAFLRRSILFDGFIPRLFRALMSSPSLDSEISWNIFIHHVAVADRGNYHRLNLLLANEPDLDDVEAINDLHGLTKGFLSQGQTIARTAWALWAATYFLELDCVPEYSRGIYTCRASVLCRSVKSLDFSHMILQTFPECQFITVKGQRLGFLKDNDGCTSCGYFCKRINLEVRHLDEIQTVFLALDASNSFKIAGFPESIRWFMDRQGLANEFGQSDHKMSQSERHCYCVPKFCGQKRKAKSTGTENRSHKHRRGL